MNNGIDIELEGKPDFLKSMLRIEAWYNCEIIDRPPVQFRSNEILHEDLNIKNTSSRFVDDWMDTEFVVDKFLKSIKEKEFRGESFPIFWPNLGPSVYSAFFGATLEFEKNTSWAIPVIKNWDDLNKLKLDFNNIYFKKLDEMTGYAIEMCSNKAIVGYTDLHPGLDCVSAWRDPQILCMDLYDEADNVKKAVKLATEAFTPVYRHFTDILIEKNQPSVSWMGVPFFDSMHIPSCDFASMISPAQFKEFAMPSLIEETRQAKFNIFHVDGKGVANHLDAICEIPGVNALQWVQGDGGGKPVMQWLPLIKEMKQKGKAVFIYVESDEIDSFMSEISPKGVFLSITTNNKDEQIDILKKIENWR